ncbi:MAG: fasciclin domain-containing protein [Balneolaceae bacterium]|nr:fasciclin domain-containing protein [Balneolaceae bacterium]
MLTIGIVLILARCDNITSSEQEKEVISPEQAKLKGNPDMAEDEEEDSYDRPAETILEIAGSNENFSILAQAVLFAGLDGALDGKRQFTVFAPTNDAFEALLETLNLTAAQLLVGRKQGAGNQYFTLSRSARAQ